MPVPTKFPNATDTNMTHILDIAKYNDAVTNGLFFPVILLVIWVVSFTGMSMVDKSKAFITSTFVTWLAAIMFWAAGAMSEWIVILLTVLMVGNLMYLVYSNVKGD